MFQLSARLAGFAAISALFSLSPAFAAELAIPDVVADSAVGECRIDIPSGNLAESGTPMEIRFTVGVSYGNFETDILTNGWDKALTTMNRPRPVTRQMTLTFDTGQATASRSGTYTAFEGYSDGARGTWEAGPGSDEALAMLKDATTVQIKFDGVNFEPTHLQTKGLVYDRLTKCVDELRKARQ